MISNLDQKLENNSLIVVVNSDASFARNKDHTLKVSCIIVLSDKDNNCQQMFWKSYKAKLVSRAFPGSEVMGFHDAFIKGLSYRIGLTRNYEQKSIPYNVYIKFMSLLSVEQCRNENW